MMQAMKLRDGKYFASPDVAAQFLGVSLQTLQRWKRQPNPPPFDSKYGYELIALGNWARTEQIYKTGKGGGTNYPWKPDFTRYADYDPITVTMPGLEVPTKQSEEVRLKAARADKVEIEVKTLRGDLVLADDVEIAMSAMVSRIKTRLLAIPTALSPQIAGISDRYEVQEQLYTNIRIALEELSSNWREDEDYLEKAG